jgi:hypothetical protein
VEHTRVLLTYVCTFYRRGCEAGQLRAFEVNSLKINLLRSKFNRVISIKTNVYCPLMGHTDSRVWDLG